MLRLLTLYLFQLGILNNQFIRTSCLVIFGCLLFSLDLLLLKLIGIVKLATDFILFLWAFIIYYVLLLISCFNLLQLYIFQIIQYNRLS
jgi:hypothetical protein